MSKHTATNTWNDGLNKDLNPVITPDTVLTDNLNGTFITYNGNEFSLQNDMGNKFVVQLSKGFYPIGVTEYGDIAYIVSVGSAEVNKIYAEQKEGSTLDPSTLDELIVTAVLQAEPNYTSFTRDIAAKILSTNGWLIPSDTVKNILTSALDTLSTDIEYNITTETSNKFEIGSFPSLNPMITPFGSEIDFEDKYRPFYNLFATKDRVKNETVIHSGDTVLDLIDADPLSNNNLLISESPYELTLKFEESRTYFSTVMLPGYDITNPVSIEAQPSYDGSVNLIITDGKNPPRLINSGFAVTNNGKGKFIVRNQDEQTNCYSESKIEEQTRLINVSTTFTKVDLGYEITNPNGTITKVNGVQQGGQLKGGNYTFYFKLGDDDGNKTDIICESGIVSIFKGNVGDPHTISGAFNNEQTDKVIHLKMSDIDTNYSKVYIAYTREYCDLNGYRLVEAKSLVEPFKINNSVEYITISGVESVQDISIEDLNINYHTVTSAKAIAQQQNMLFLGNISSEDPNSAELQNCSYEIEVGLEQADDLGMVDVSSYNVNNPEESEYYNPENIYYKLGYWPDEIYRLGVVYIRSDGSTTPVYNLKGCKFTTITETNRSNGVIDHLTVSHKNDYTKSKDGLFIDNTNALDNLAGVFKLPWKNVLKNGIIQPLYFSFKLNSNLVKQLQSLNVIGYFIVRQKRIPITVCQGYSVGIDKNAYIPMIYSNDDNKWIAESFITSNTTQQEISQQELEWLQNYLTQNGLFDYLDLINKLYGTDNEGNRRLVYNAVKLDDNGIVSIDQVMKAYLAESSYLEWTGPFTRVRKYKVRLIAPKDKDNLDYEWNKFINTNRETAKQSAINWYNSNVTTLQSAWNNAGLTVAPDFVSTHSETNLNIVLASYNVKFDISFNKKRKIDSVQKRGKGLLSVEAMTNPQIQSLLCGTKFELKPFNKCTNVQNWPMFYVSNYATPPGTSYLSVNAKLIYIPENTPLKYVDECGFSTQVGDGINVKDFRFLESQINSNVATEDKVVRGHFTPFIGCITETDNAISDNYLYDIRVPHDESYKSDMVTRANDNSEYFAITNKTPIEDSVDAFRGDCFTNTVTVRMHRNFIDQTAPVADMIVKPTCWHDYYKGYNNVPSSEDDTDLENKTRWNEINVGDLNTVSLGHWITFKCLASSNLGLRSEDTSNVSEMALLGNPRSFYPLTDASTSTGMKLPDTTLLNSGYGATVGRRRNNLKQKTPFDKNEFSNRIMFSNVSVTDSFTNGYRVFQGLSYHDYTKQYGSIIKLIPWGNNLFCVFEHGIAIVPVNEKALMQTTTEQTIHIYGHGVLPDQLSIISQDFGSIWADSVIRTPIGIYGVDTSAKKIWKYTDKKGLETISDMKLQRFLNDNINLDKTRSEKLGITNVKTHFNNYKGDVMFTFYHTDSKGVQKKWSLCYNERQGLWVTRYSWLPLQSFNINNTFYSIPHEEYTENITSGIWKHGRTGIDTKFTPTKWYGNQEPFEFEFVVSDPAGVQKIFEDLKIISNNVQPTDIEFELVGDSYLFNRARIYHDTNDIPSNVYGQLNTDEPYKQTIDDRTKDVYSFVNNKLLFKNAKVNYDSVLDEYTICVQQPCLNKDSHGIRLGNIQYKEDGWYTNIEPLRYNLKLNLNEVTAFNPDDKFGSAKLRDKWVKIRIKYDGKRLAIVNGVTTFENISYA